MMERSTVKNRHVLILAKWYPNRRDPQLGVFIEKHVKAIALHHRVTVFHAMSDPSKTSGEIEFSEEKTGNIHECTLYYKPFKGIFAPLINAFRYYQSWNIFKQKTEVFSKKENRPDVLLAYILLRTAFLAWWTGRQNDIPFYISEQWSGFASGKVDEKPWYWKRICRYLLAKAKGVSAVSDFLKHKLEDYSGRSDVKVLHNIIEPGLVPSSNSSQSSINVLLVADLVDEIKNISAVIRMFARVHKERPDARLHIVGDGKDRDLLVGIAHETGLLGKAVFFEGRKSNKEVYARLKDSAFLVMNSRYETFSLICAEALVCGKPVIATACGGPQEFITERFGLLIPPDDDQALQLALRKMFDTYSGYPAEDLRKFAEKEFGISGVGLDFHYWLGS